MNNINVCPGCGHLLQTNNSEALGYIKNINEESKKVQYCKRCYEMIFRNVAPEVFLDNEDYWNLFEDIVSKDEIYVLIIDLFNIEGTIIPQMIEELKNKKVILVLNKRDLLPKLVDNQKIKTNVLENNLLSKLNIIETIVTSSLKKYNIDELLDAIKTHRQGNTYLIGCANVGKSSLVNALINSVLGENTEHIATSYFAGTTLGLIEIPLDAEYNLIDTPGIINTKDLNMNLEKETLEIIFPKKEMRPVTYQLEDQQTLFISGFCQLDYLKGPVQGLTIYSSNQIYIHRTKLENALEIRESHLGKELLSPPSIKELEKIKFKTEQLYIHPGNYDISISGLTWVNLKNKNNFKLEFQVTVPEQVSIKIRKALI